MVSTVNLLSPTQPATEETFVAHDRRRPAPFFVATWSDAGLAMLYSNDLDLDQQRMQSLSCLDDAFKQHGRPEQSAIHQLDDTTRLRVVPLAGEIGCAFAVFVERMTTRASIEVMTQRYRLTRREVEVLVLVVGGKTGREIADMLYITTATVNDHTGSLLRKIGVRRRLELLTVMQECAWDSEQPEGEELPTLASRGQGGRPPCTKAIGKFAERL